MQTTKSAPPPSQICPSSLARRDFLRLLLGGAAGAALPWPRATAAGSNAFSFLLLGDLHFDRLTHHDLEWLEKEKPDDLRQVRDYSRLTAELQPQLFETLRTCSTASKPQRAPVAFVAQVGDLVEGLCGSEPLATRQNTEVLEFLRESKLDVPFLFTKGNHDITGPGAPEAFKSVFQPFMAQQAAAVTGNSRVTGASYTVETRDSLCCFFDAYDRESLPWLEASLGKRTARHCFVILHPPVVPYGARATWHLYATERDKVKRERLLELLGKHNAFVLTGHIHKFNVLVRSTGGGGRFLQLALSSVITTPEPKARVHLTGVSEYNTEQVKVEPGFSPATETQRRAVYETEAPFVRHFEYTDLPGFATITVDGPKVSASMYSGVRQNLWRTIELDALLAA